jgi:hypothetical protein
LFGTYCDKITVFDPYRAANKDAEKKSTGVEDVILVPPITPEVMTPEEMAPEEDVVAISPPTPTTVNKTSGAREHEDLVIVVSQETLQSASDKGSTKSKKCLGKRKHEQVVVFAPVPITPKGKKKIFRRDMPKRSSRKQLSDNAVSLPTEDDQDPVAKRLDSFVNSRCGSGSVDKKSVSSNQETDGTVIAPESTLPTPAHLLPTPAHLLPTPAPTSAPRLLLPELRVDKAVKQEGKSHVMVVFPHTAGNITVIYPKAIITQAANKEACTTSQSAAIRSSVAEAVTDAGPVVSLQPTKPVSSSSAPPPKSPLRMPENLMSTSTAATPMLLYRNKFHQVKGSTESELVIADLPQRPTQVGIVSPMNQGQGSVATSLTTVSTQRESVIVHSSHESNTANTATVLQGQRFTAPARTLQSYFIHNTQSFEESPFSARFVPPPVTFEGLTTSNTSASQMFSQGTGSSMDFSRSAGVEGFVVSAANMEASTHGPNRLTFPASYLLQELFATNLQTQDVRNLKGETDPQNNQGLNSLAYTNQQQSSQSQGLVSLLQSNQQQSSQPQGLVSLLQSNQQQSSQPPSCEPARVTENYVPDVSLRRSVFGVASVRHSSGKNINVYHVPVGPVDSMTSSQHSARPCAPSQNVLKEPIPPHIGLFNSNPTSGLKTSNSTIGSQPIVTFSAPPEPCVSHLTPYLSVVRPTASTAGSALPQRDQHQASWTTPLA